MSKTLIVATDPFDSETWEVSHHEDLLAALVEKYGESFPSNARIYHDCVSEETDVTPAVEGDVQNLAELQGTFYVMHYPEGPLIIAAVIIAIAAIAAAFIMKPKVPSTTTNNNNRQSSNNSLSDRKNEARVGKRIPYIVGTRYVFPDMAALAYKTLSGGQEVEHALFCVGQGWYDYQAAWEDTTKFDEISGNSLMAFDPNTDILNSKPVWTLGQSFSEPLYITKGSTSVSDQVLRPTNSGTINAIKSITFTYPDTIEFTNSSGDDDDIDFTDHFDASDTLQITNTSFNVTNADGSISKVSLDGTYKALTVTSDTIVLSNPVAVNSNWEYLENNQLKDTSVTIASISDKWVGPFDLFMEDRDRVIANVRARNGLYRLGSKKGQQFKETVDILMEVTPLDANGVPSGAAETMTGTVEGSAVSRDSTGITLDLKTSFTGPCRVRIRRTSQTLAQSKDQYVDTVVLSELYAAQEYDSYNFGDVSMIRTKTYATASAVSVSERKLTLLVTRRLPARTADGTGFTTELYPTDNVADIFCAICLEPTIGNRNLSQLDLDNIYNTIADAEAYFGSENLVRFAYSFDDAKVSFEESLSYVAGAIGCQAYRRGSKIRLSFERQNDDSVMLFNHRNKVPSTEKRTVTFGKYNDYDGVQLDWIDPNDFDSTQTLYIPNAGAVNPKKLEYVGIRSEGQASMLAYRDWYKILYQNVTVEFTGLHEANVLMLDDRILNTDNTRPNMIDGEVRAINGNVLTLSQRHRMLSTDSFTIYLQLSDGTTQALPVTAADNDYKVTLGGTPRLPLIADSSYYAQTVYHIVSPNLKAPRAFLIEDLDVQDDFTVKVTAKNYDDRFYQKDQSFT